MPGHFEKNELGHTMTIKLNGVLLCIGIFAGIAAFLRVATEKIETDREYSEILAVLGMCLFALWNSAGLSLIVLFPSITTVHRERVKQIIVHLYLSLLYFRT